MPDFWPRNPSQSCGRRSGRGPSAARLKRAHTARQPEFNLQLARRAFVLLVIHTHVDGPESLAINPAPDDMLVGARRASHAR